MARSVVNGIINSGAGYTVPAGKYVVIEAYGSGSGQALTIDGASNRAYVGPNTSIKIVLDAGQIIKSTGGDIGFSGFIYDK